jgi:hypothetical protein
MVASRRFFRAKGQTGRGLPPSSRNHVLQYSLILSVKEQT